MIIVAVGANLPGPGNTAPLQTCIGAVTAIGRLPGYSVRAVSAWYETAPVPVSDQPPYVNGIVGVTGPEEPERLLAALQQIERQSGRTRGAANAARTLDLDIVAMGDLVRAGPDPILPHPRAHLRAFVLRPLADIAPDWVHPVLGKRVRDLLESVSVEGIRRLAPGV